MIKFITSFLSLLWILLVGTPQPKHNLHRQPTRDDFKKEISYWIALNFNYIALTAIVFLIIFFVWFCFWSVGVSAVESGTVYNHMGGVI